MSNQKLNSKPRKLFGRRVKQLRAQGIVPANIFGPKTKSLAISIDKKEFLKVYDQSGETSLIDLSVEGEKDVRPVLISNIHIDPVTSHVLHADLHQVDLKSKTTADIPLEFIGESAAVKSGNILVTLRNEVEVEALPTDLPEKIEIDISALEEVGASILAKDLKVDRSKVELKIDADEPIVTIQAPAEEEAEPEPVVEEGETSDEGDGEGAPAEGDKSDEKPAEGDKQDDKSKTKPTDSKE